MKDKLIIPDLTRRMMNIEKDVIPVTKEFKQLLIENGYAITEMNHNADVMIHRAEKEFEKMHVSFFFYIDPRLTEVKYTIIGKIPVELPDENSEKNEK